MRLKDLAHHLGLSQTTVSRALNGYPEVSEASRLRVIEAAERFGYRPDSTARRLATGRAGAIGVLFPFGYKVELDLHFAEFLAGLAEGAAALDFDVLLKASRDDDGFAAHARARSVDALIVTGPAVADPRLIAVLEQELPAVVHGRTRCDRPYAFLDIDNEGAFFAATALLARQGHREIGLINGDVRQTFAQHRDWGWRRALAAHALPARDEFALSAAMTEENGWRFANQLFQCSPRPTALVCSSMLMALGVVRAIHEQGLKLGEDIALIAHDDGLTALRPECITPALTTTFSSIRAAGLRLAEIAARVAAGADPASIAEIWPVPLIERGSTPPPGAI